MTAESQTAGPEEGSTARQWPWQPKHTPASTIPGPLLGNRLLNMLLNNGGVLGSGVPCLGYTEAI